MADLPRADAKKQGDAIRAHRLRNQIVATKVASRLVQPAWPKRRAGHDRGGGRSLPQVVTAFLVMERLLDLKNLWAKIEKAEVSEQVRIELSRWPRGASAIIWAT